MGELVTNYSKHINFEKGIYDINDYIALHHDKPTMWKKYREEWNNKKICKLRFLLLETKSKCNLKCPMCAHSVGYEQCEDMSDLLFEKCIQEIEKMQIPSVCMNQINEPLLDQKITQRIGRIAKLECVLDIHMNTNAVLLTPSKTSEILESGLHRILFGFDAFYKESYEKIRKGAKFDKVLKNILFFLEEKEKRKKIFPITRISAVRMKSNEEEIEKWINFWKDKVDYLTIQEYVETTGENRSSAFLANSNIRNQNHIECHSPFERAVVRGNGDILPCCNTQSVKMPIGNLLRQELSEIWNGTYQLEDGGGDTLQLSNCVQYYKTTNGLKIQFVKIV